MRRRVADGRLADLDRHVGAGLGAARRAAALTHRLLAFSRRQTLEPKPLALNKMVSGMEELVRRTMGPAVELEVVAGVGLWTVQADASQLENALLNLCINACDAMPGGGRLTIETANRRIDERTAIGAHIVPGQYVKRQRRRDDPGRGGPGLRPVFHDQAYRHGDGARALDVLGLRQAVGRPRPHLLGEVGKGSMVCVYLPRGLTGDPQGEAKEEPPQDAHAEAAQTVLVLD